MSFIRSQDDLQALRHNNFMYNKDEELRRSTGSIYGGDSPTKNRPPTMHVRSNSDQSEINFALRASEIEPRSPTGESFFAIVRKFEENIQNERTVSTSRGTLQGSVVDGIRGQHAATFPSMDKKTPILRRKNSLRSNTTSFFRSKRGNDNLKEGDADVGDVPLRKTFAHYDCQSLNVNFDEQIQLRLRYGDGLRRKNTRSGASAASARITAATVADRQQDGSNSSLDRLEEIPDYGDNKSNELVLSCPYFRNELGGEDDLDPKISLTRDNPAFQNPYNSADPKERKANAGKRRSTLDILLTAYDSARRGNLRTGTGVTILDNSKPESGSLYLGEGATTSDEEGKVVFEHADHGAYYYRNFFVGQEHLTYLGMDDRLGPVAVSLKREKLDENSSLIRNDTDGGTQYQYRIICRTSELTTLRGNILEEAIPSTSRHGTARALPAKDILEYVVPEIQLPQLKLALPTIKVPEQLMKLDEQGMTNQYKVGILYCKAGQSTEEEMYNNQVSSPAFDEFLNLIGKKVRLKGFDGYRAQLDNRNDSTGEYSVYTKFNNREIMFHVSTLLPWTPNNKQQLLRKRHIGNDIVTIVFQEPGALAFTPKNIRSHFQHVFIVIRVFNPCSDNTYYRVAMSRSKDVPPFGPPIPAGPKFGKQKAFANFLLAKIINAENAAHKSEKFSAMATRTRHEYLKDLATNYISGTTLDSGTKSFGKFSLSSKKKEKIHPPICPEIVCRGGLAWHVQVEDYRNSTMIECVMAISADTLVLVDSSTKETLFSVPCKAIIGWTALSASIKVFYGSGDCLVVNIPTYESDDLPEIVRRLGAVTIGCQTQTLTLRRNVHGQLGFHVQYEGLVADVEMGGYAYQAGLRQGCRLVEINGMIVATLSHDQMIDILRKPGSVTVVVVSPLPSGKPRKGVQQSGQQYWWSARSSTTTISSYSGSFSSVGEEHDTREVKAPKPLSALGRPGAPWPGKPGDETSTSSGSSVLAAISNHKNSGSTSSATESSLTLNDDTRTQALNYGSAYTVNTQNPPETGTNPLSSQHSGSTSSTENSISNHTRPMWRGVAPVDTDVTPGVTLKAPTSKGTLYVIASGPQSPSLTSPKTPDIPIFGSTSQRPERHWRAVVNEQGEVVMSEGEGERGVVPQANGVGPPAQQAAQGDMVPFKETSLGAVVTTTNTYKKQSFEEITEASMTETVDKIEKAFGFKTPKATDTPIKAHDYGQFERSASLRRSNRSPRSSAEDVNRVKTAANSLGRKASASERPSPDAHRGPSDPRKLSNGAAERPSGELRHSNSNTEHSGLVIHHEVKKEHARTLSAEELEVQLILEELQQAERDLGASEGRVQTVVEVTRNKDDVILESSQKPKEVDQRLVARNNLIERIESQRHALANESVEGVRIYHAKSRSTPADITKPGYSAARQQKYASSQDDITGRVRQERERIEQRKSQSIRDLGDHRYSARRRRSEQTPDRPNGPDATPSPRSVKPVVRSERRIKLSQSGPSSEMTEQKAQTLPRCKPNRRRHTTKQPSESDSSDEDPRLTTRDRTRDVSRTATAVLLPEKSRKGSSLPRDGDSGRTSDKHPPPHLRGARITRLKLSASEEPEDSLVEQTSRLLSATEDSAGPKPSIVIQEDVLHSLTQATDLLASQRPTRDERARDRSRHSKDSKTDKAMAKIKAHASRGRSHGPHKFHIPVVPRRHSFDDRIFARTASRPPGRESSLTRESIGREAELEMKLAIVSNALMKEGEERQKMETELKRLHRENRRLTEDLRTASGQLRKFTEWFFRNVDQGHS